MKKETLLEVANSMPDEFHVDEIISHIIINEKIDKVIADYKAGHYLTSEEVGQKIEEIKMRYNRNAT